MLDAQASGCYDGLRAKKAPDLANQPRTKELPLNLMLSNKGLSLAQQNVITFLKLNSTKTHV